MKNTNNSVKKHQTYWVLLLAMMISGHLGATVNNYVGAFANIGEWTLLPAESNFGPSFGASGVVGGMYELQAGPRFTQRRFLFNVGIGLSGGYTSFIQTANMEQQKLLDQKDIDGDTFDYIYEVSDRHDGYANFAVQIPVMFGFQFRKFYMLAGVKPTFNIKTWSVNTATVTTYGYYNQYITHEFRDMPKNQFFTGRPIKSRPDVSLGLDLNASLEIGGRLGEVVEGAGFDVPKRKKEYRLAGFVDFGVLDSHKANTQKGYDHDSEYDASKVYDEAGKKTSMIDGDKTNGIEGVQLNDIMSTNGFAKAVHNLTIGIKFTVLFQMPEKSTGVLYEWETPRPLRRRR